MIEIFTSYEAFASLTPAIQFVVLIIAAVGAYVVVLAVRAFLTFCIGLTR